VTDPSELLALRLALIGIIFAFVLVTALILRGTLMPRSRAQPSGAAAMLIVVSPARTGLSPGTQFSLAGETTIGRDAANGIVLADASVSGRHAIIDAYGAAWAIRDLGSTNGTRVDGEDVAGDRVALRSGAMLQVGAVRFSFDISAGTNSTARSP